MAATAQGERGRATAFDCDHCKESFEQYELTAVQVGDTDDSIRGWFCGHCIGAFEDVLGTFMKQPRPAPAPQRPGAGINLHCAWCGTRVVVHPVRMDELLPHWGWRFMRRHGWVCPNHQG